MNKAEKVRRKLGMTKTKAGELFSHYESRAACRNWIRWESSGNWPDALDRLFNVILTLKIAQDDKITGCQKALDLVVAEIGRK